MHIDVTRRRLLAGAALLAAGTVSAQAYPDKSRPIRAIAPNGAGTSIDLLSRAVARGLTDVAGMNVVVDNRPGGEAVIGAQAAKTSPPDGYTMFFTSLSSQVLNPHTFKQLPYDPLVDFIPIAGLAQTPLLMHLGSSTTFKTAREFIAAAKATPGKYTYGSGTATTRLAGEMLQRAAGIQLLNVPYKSLTDAMSHLASGQIDLVIIDMASANAFYAQGVRPVATTTASRISKMPQLPTMQEEGVPNFEVVGWFAAYFPAKTPAPIVATMRDAISAAVKTKYVQDLYQTFGMEPLPLVGEQLETFQKQEFDKWGKAIRAAGMDGKF